MIESIFIAETHGAPQFEVQEAELVADKGIKGDRNVNGTVTFIEAEEVESFNGDHNRSIEASETGRNIVTRSVRLNSLAGKTFSVGGVQFYGVELCEPCKTLGQRLATDGMSPAEVVRAWVHKGGLRANVLSSGALRSGMEFDV
ncbi:MOSC domain-containing protein [Halomonadaceae bacterium KBTZ08]